MLIGRMVCEKFLGTKSLLVTLYHYSLVKVINSTSNGVAVSNEIDVIVTFCLR